jgi:hypothetical protein
LMHFAHANNREIVFLFSVPNSAGPTIWSPGTQVLPHAS